MRDRDRFSRIVRTVVVAIEVSAVGEAVPASREEAVEDRARFDAEQREERTRRREEQRARRRDNKRREALARVATVEEAGGASEGSEASVGDTTVPGEPARPRRRPRVTEVRDEVDTSVPDTELDGMEPIDVVMMAHANGVEASA